MSTTDMRLTVKCGTRVVGPEDVLGPAGSSPVGREEVHPDRSWPAGRIEPSYWGPCWEQVRASDRVERDVRKAQSESAHVGWRPNRIGAISKLGGGVIGSNELITTYYSP
jgi:hypothetical protein